MGGLCSTENNNRKVSSSFSYEDEFLTKKSIKKKKNMIPNGETSVKKRKSKKLFFSQKEKTPEEIKLYLYQNRFSTYQTDYFNKREMEYYEKIMEKEKTLKKTNLIKKKIKCKEDKLLGTGSFGTVTRGFDSNNRITMAIKRIYIGDSSNKKLKTELIKEDEILRELKHPNIVNYYGSELDQEYLKIYIEYIDMGSIASMLKTYGPFPEEIVRRYTRQILSGLEYLHYHNVIHRDIKGANILVNNDGQVKLSDFGSAKKLKKTYLSSFIGTTCWMAPEIILNKSYERFADIWSLGCTVYEMLVGQPPFLGKNHYEISVKIINHQDDEFKYPSSLSLNAVDFLKCCLKKGPYERKNVYKLLQHPFIIEGKKKLNFEESGDVSCLEFDTYNSQFHNFIKKKTKKRFDQINDNVDKKNNDNVDRLNNSSRIKDSKIKDSKEESTDIMSRRNFSKFKISENHKSRGNSNKQKKSYTEIFEKLRKKKKDLKTQKYSKKNKSSNKKVSRSHNYPPVKKNNFTKGKKNLDLKNMNSLSRNYHKKKNVSGQIRFDDLSDNEEDLTTIIPKYLKYKKSKKKSNSNFIDFRNK